MSSVKECSGHTIHTCPYSSACVLFDLSAFIRIEKPRDDLLRLRKQESTDLRA